MILELNTGNTEQRPMKEYTLAYAAGLMDAEGCFSIYKPKSSGKTTSYQARIVLSSIELSLIKWLVETFGGFYTTHRPNKGRVWYQWNINSHKAAAKFLSGILPYLRIKKSEAEVLEEFVSLALRDARSLVLHFTGKVTIGKLGGKLNLTAGRRKFNRVAK